MKTALAILAGTLLTACATVRAEPAPVEGPVAMGQAAFVDGPVVTPIEVIEDSRCPMNARCIWAGRLILRVNVLGGSWRRSMDLTLGEPQHVADGALALVSVTPEQQTGSEIAPGDYRFAFEFQGGL